MLSELFELQLPNTMIGIFKTTENTFLKYHHNFSIFQLNGKSRSKMSHIILNLNLVFYNFVILSV